MTSADKDLLDKLNQTGPGFCAAKWYNSTIWLSNGRTSSCHLPPAHSIDIEKIKDNPSALHNTDYKKSVRAEMLSGKRPDECGYCWKVEDAAPDAISDRVYKSKLYTHEQLESITTADPYEDINPRTLEISFDNVCDYQCTYCNSEFSTTWNADIFRNGGYDLKTSQGQTYNQPFEFDSNIIKKPTPYSEAFIKWYNSGLKDDLDELRITGGEPTMSPSFWKFVDTIDNPKFRFSVNSNLGMSDAVMDRFIDCTRKFDNFELYTSVESSPKISEFVRGGFKWNTWMHNLTNFIQRANYQSINIMMTISILSLPGLVEFLNEYRKLKQSYPDKKITISANILRFPNFQSVNNLPGHLKKRYSNDLKRWLNSYDEELVDFELQHLDRLCDYLDNVEASYEDTDTLADKHQDLAKFVSTYSARRRLNISDIYERDFSEWLVTLKK